MLAYQTQGWDAKTQRLTQLTHAPLAGPGFHSPTPTDITLFHHVPPQRPEFWGALNGEYTISRVTHADFVHMLREAVRDCNVKFNPSGERSPVTVGFHSESTALAAGGPFARVELEACDEVWRLSTDDWARVMLHVVHLGKHAAGIETSVFPACVWRILQCCTRELHGIFDMVAGPDVTYACLPSDPHCKPGPAVRMRQAQVFVFLAVKAFTLNNAQRFQLRGIWQQTLLLLRTRSHCLPSKFGPAARLPTLQAGIQAVRFLLDALYVMTDSIATYLRRQLLDDRSKGLAYDNLWAAAGTLAMTGPHLAPSRRALRAVRTEPTTVVVVARELLRTLQARPLFPRSVCSSRAFSDRPTGRTGRSWRGCGMGVRARRHAGRLGRLALLGQLRRRDAHQRP